MNDQYEQALLLIMQRLPMFARQGAKAVKVGLRNIRLLCAALGHPEQQFKSIHIAGTNGKGSTSHIIAAACMKAGMRTGLYTSPHLVDIRERVRIDGQMMPKEAFIEFVQLSEALIEEYAPSYFELNVAMAFWYFAQQKVDIAVIETGLGGRLDSTNVIMPAISVITNIGLDHTDILGHTLAAIAGEKAGIIKEGVPVVIGEATPETAPVFDSKAEECNTRCHYAADSFSFVAASPRHTYAELIIRDLATGVYYTIETDMVATFQQKNIITAWTAIRRLAADGWPLGDEAFIAALQNVKSATGLRGRWDWVRPNVVLDVAHNPDGIAQLLPNIASIKGPIKILYGSVSDKDVRGVVAQLPANAEYHIAAAAVPRAMPVQALSAIFADAKLPASAHATVAAALQQLLATLADDETLIIMGSFFVVGEAYAYLDTL